MTELQESGKDAVRLLLWLENRNFKLDRKKAESKPQQ